MRALTWLLVAAMLAGCLGGGDDRPAAATDDPDAPVEAPWWSVGESWTVRFARQGQPSRTVTLVNFANDSWDPAHFWLGVADRQQALDHVFFDDNPFLGRIHHVLLAPHEKGMHSAMYEWPLVDGARWTTPLLLGKQDVAVEARARGDGTFLVTGQARADGASVEYDYDPATRWFRELTIREPGGATYLHAVVTDHKEGGAKGTYHFLRGRDYLDADGGATGETETFTVKEEGATSIAFLLDVQAGPGSRLDFLDPSGRLVHSETLLAGGTSDKVVEIAQRPAPGEWTLRYVGSVQGAIKVRGIVEHKATL